MPHILSYFSFIIIISLPLITQAKDHSKKSTSFTVNLPAIAHGAVIPTEYAFCKSKGTLGANKSPEIKWSGAPAGTKSFAILAVDPKVPSKADNVNKEGKTVSKDLPRVDFFHWVLANIPASVTHLPSGAESDKVVPKGKPTGQAKSGLRGVNNYSDWFATNPDMSGQYGGYDGPCPPWNDEIVHEYHFEVYALDIETLSLKNGFKGPDLLKAMKGHILAKAKSVGRFKLNPEVKY